MTVVELKAQLNALIEQEDSVEKLEAAKAVLSGEEAATTTWQQEETTQRLQQISEGNMSVRAWTDAKEDRCAE